MDAKAFDRITRSQPPPPAMLRERAAGGQDLVMDNLPLAGMGQVNKKPPKV
jgi:hypothetical protein